MNSNDYELIIQRNPMALKLLFEELNPFLYRMCISQKVFKEHADEVIHDTWATFFTNIERFENRSTLRTFVCGILINKIREYRRANNRFSYHEDAEEIFSQSFSAKGWWATRASSPFQASYDKQTYGFINDCLEGLSEQQSAAFMLREIEGESTEDICNTLGISVSHLRVLLFRAKDKLRQCLEGKMGAGFNINDQTHGDQT